MKCQNNKSEFILHKILVVFKNLKLMVFKILKTNKLESCSARKFVCREVDNSETSHFNCPKWTEWNEWSECIAQHPCSPNRTRYERKQLRECTHHDDCMIDCIGSTEKTEGTKTNILRIKNLKRL